MKPYSVILAKQSLEYAYIDAFAGSGLHLTKNEKKIVPGSPLEALMIEPPFDKYYFIEMDKRKAEMLKHHINWRENVQIFSGDCNEILLHEVFPQVRYEQYRRAICFLDPFNIGINWEVIEKAGEMRSIEIILNFDIMDINRNLKIEPKSKIRESDLERINRFWGDQTWREYLYQTELGLFGEIIDRKPGNISIIQAFRERLKKKARFKFVPEPVPMCNTKGAVIYYLFFATQNEKGNKIMSDIFKAYRSKIG